MTPVEQTALLLRQTAALRRRGRSHADALTAARAGLPPGPLAQRVDGALRTLAAGEAPAARGDTLEAVLAGAGEGVDHLDHAALALDTQLQVEASLSLARLYITLAVALPLLVGTVLGFAETGGLANDQTTAPWLLFGATTWMLKAIGVPLAVAWALLIRFLRVRAPGTDHLRRATGLLQAAAQGHVSPALLGNETERRYFDARGSACGEVQAAVEIAEELVITGEARVRLFRHLAPVLAALLFFLLSWIGTAALAVPLIDSWSNWMRF